MKEAIGTLEKERTGDGGKVTGCSEARESKGRSRNSSIDISGTAKSVGSPKMTGVRGASGTSGAVDDDEDDDEDDEISILVV